jgi:hypothetical protein|tara:strand:+ start:1853 stop:3685 length:1833 start_codon:yes stop_codon:yes gene_type:complete
MATSVVQPNFYTSVNSPTYILALYIVHPEVSNDPAHFLGPGAEKGTLDRGAAKRIAQSGIETERYLDNVVMTSFGRTSSALGNVATTSINFDIIEPFQFTLMQDILTLTKDYGFGNMQNALYVMKLEFKGRNVVDDTELKFPTIHFFPLTFTQINSSIGPEGARYNILANMNTKTALSQATITKDINFQCTTAGSFVKNLETELNNYERSIRDENYNVLDTAKTWKINLSKEFKATYENAAMFGLGDHESNLMKWNSDGDIIKQQITGYYALHRTIPIGSSVPTFVQQQLIKGLAKILNDNNDLLKMEMSIKHFKEIDRQTGQLRKEIIIDVYHVRKHAGSSDRIGNKIDKDQTQKYKDKVAKKKKERDDIQLQKQRLALIGTRLHKKYQYIHTGKNTEVLDVDIQYNLLYFDEKAPADGKGSKNQSVLINANVTPLGAVGNTQGPPGNAFASLGDHANSYNTPVYEYAPASINEGTGEGDSAGNMALAVKNHEMDGYTTAMQNIDLSIVGDPYWVGSPDAEIIPDGSIYSNKQNDKHDVHIAFINYLGDPSFASLGKRSGRQLDLASSGIYRVATITTRLSGGKFTQQLTAFKEPDITTEFLQNELENL